MVNGSCARMHVRWKAIVAVLIAVAASVYMIGYSLATVVLPAMIGIIVVWKLPAAKDPRSGAARYAEFPDGATLC